VLKIKPQANPIMPELITDTARLEKFKTWVHSYSDMLYSHTIQRGFDRDTARDIVQETFYSAWKGMASFEGKASAKNWLFVILKNKITDHYRKSQNHWQPSEQNYFEDNGHWEKTAYPKELVIDPRDQSDRSEFDRILETCSSKLSSIQKAVFFMKYVDEVDSEIICTELSITVNNYWTMLHRAKVQLRDCLQKKWFMTKGL
jgi:RNA polymerase sigma-70 factor (TIGR02943 family)